MRVWQWHVQCWFFRCFCTSPCVPEAYRKIGLFGRWRLCFCHPLYLEVTFSSCLPEVYEFAYFWELTPGMVSVFSTLLGSTVNTCSASVYEAFWKNFTLSYVKGGLSDPVVDTRPSDCKLWSLRSCSFIQFVDISVMAHRQSLTVQTVRQTIDFLQLLYKVVDVPVCKSCRFPCCGAEACPMVQTVCTIVIPLLQFLDMVIDAPVAQVCRFPGRRSGDSRVLTVPLLRKSSFPGGPGQGCRHACWRVDMAQLIVVVMS